MVNWVCNLARDGVINGFVDCHEVFRIIKLSAAGNHTIGAGREPGTKYRLINVTYTIPEFGDFGEFDTICAAQESAGLMIGVAAASRENADGPDGWI